MSIILLLLVSIGYNVLQISEGTNRLALCVGIWAFAYVLLAAAADYLV